MIPLAIFLLACAAVYLGVIDAGFSALMRLSLRLVAERSNRPGAIGEYLDDPLLLFIPVRLLIGAAVPGALPEILASRLCTVFCRSTNCWLSLPMRDLISSRLSETPWTWVDMVSRRAPELACTS